MTAYELIYNLIDSKDLNILGACLLLACANGHSGVVNLLLDENPIDRSACVEEE